MRILPEKLARLAGILLIAGAAVLSAGLARRAWAGDVGFDGSTDAGQVSGASGQNSLGLGQTNFSAETNAPQSAQAMTQLAVVPPNIVPSVVGPAQIIIIRHGEKPPKGGGNGLSPQGQERAQELVGFFEHNPQVTQYGTPAAIFAMQPSAEDPSTRPVDTVTPLSQSLGIPINTDFPRDDISGLVQAIMSNASYVGKMVLICWEHKHIGPIAQALGVPPAQIPAWPGSVFNRAWIINFDGGKVASFQNIPQNLPMDNGSN